MEYTNTLLRHPFPENLCRNKTIATTEGSICSGMSIANAIGAYKGARFIEVSAFIESWHFVL